MQKIDFASVYDTLPAASVVLSPDLVIQAVNRAFEKMTGLDRADMVGRYLFDVPTAPAKEGTELRASLNRVLTEGEADIIALMRFDLPAPGRPGGFEERYWNVVNAPKLDPDGNVELIIQRIQEITPFIDQVRGQVRSSAEAAPQQILQIEVELFARARELQAVNQRLSRAQDRGRRAIAALERQIQQHREAVADASHDLKNPITGLQARLECALANPGADPDADMRQMLLAALHDAERLDEIVSELLELARLDFETGIHTQPIDLAELVRTELAHRVPTIARTTHLQPGTIVNGSTIQLARLLDNLVSNAERHARSHVEVHVAAARDWAILEVIDDGPGIPAAEREAAFRRFHRHGAAKGTGLGLPISRKIAHNHGGTLHIADNPTGARLVLRLPRAHRPDAGPPASP